VDALFDAAVGIIDRSVTVEEAMQNGEEYLSRAVRCAAQLIKLGRTS
jgi:hypothetical protein